MMIMMMMTMLTRGLARLLSTCSRHGVGRRRRWEEGERQAELRTPRRVSRGVNA